MKRVFRLRRPADFQRVRRLGKAFAHPFVVLIALSNDLSQSRIGVAAGKSVGNAVQRNRAKRILRAAMHPLMNELVTGQDILLLGRVGIKGANSSELKPVLQNLIRQAGLQRNGKET